MAKTKILIVEDNQMLLDIYSTVFDKAGFQVLTATNGEEGYNIASKEKPDVMLLDILLPGKINGLDVLRQVKQNDETCHIPALIITNLSDDKTINEGMSLGASGYFTKSQFNPDEVVMTVKTLLK
ncbi:MAG TPA: response regulator [Candidatus Methylomirabilis sp.]|nr:response regulator [Candidatus Methylomirabilis sp.]